jgi:hypothetical protein
LKRAEEHRIQILVRAVNGAHHVEHGFRVDAEYVYPASAIKTFLSVAALRALRARAPGERANPFTDTVDALQRRSDNAAFAKLYDFVGHRALNETWRDLGFSSVRFHHRMGQTRAQGLVLPAMAVRVGSTTIRLPQRTSNLVLPPTRAERLEVGERHKRRDGVTVDGPKSFAEKNYASLRDLQRLNLSLVEPEASDAVALGLRDEDRRMLLAAMSAMTDGAEHHKPLLAGLRRVLPDDAIHYIGKSGRAYGFHIANAYVQNTSNGHAMYVTASIYANPNGVVNDDVYDYAGSTVPYLAALGEALGRALLK